MSKIKDWYIYDTPGLDIWNEKDRIAFFNGLRGEECMPIFVMAPRTSGRFRKEDALSLTRFINPSPLLQYGIIVNFCSPTEKASFLKFLEENNVPKPFTILFIPTTEDLQSHEAELCQVFSYFFLDF